MSSLERSIFKTYFLTLLCLVITIHSKGQESGIGIKDLKGTVYNIRDDMTGYVEQIEKFPIEDVIFPNEINYPCSLPQKLDSLKLDRIVNFKLNKNEKVKIYRKPNCFLAKTV